MTREEILSHVDHTLLKPEATWPQIQTLCDEAIANHTASICINTCYVSIVEVCACGESCLFLLFTCWQLRMVPPRWTWSSTSVA